MEEENKNIEAEEPTEVLGNTGVIEPVVETPTEPVVEVKQSVLDKILNFINPPKAEEAPVVETPNEPGNASSLPSNPLEKATGEPQDEPKVEEPITTPTVEEKPAEEPQIDINELNSTIENLKSELEALRQKNELLENEKVTLAEKVNELGRTPSARPVDTNAKPNAGDAYTAWREQMAQYLR